MKEITLKCGLTVRVDEKVTNDMELLDAVREASGENPTALSAVVLRLLGKEQRERVYNTLREEGIVPVDKVTEAVADIFKGLGEQGKN